MEFLKRWFGKEADGRQRSGTGDLERRLEEYEEEARRAGWGFKGSPLNKAGDLCVERGEHRRALKYYGRAIDTFLEDGQQGTARAVANKMVRINPRAVRTLCTLTWLDLASQHLGMARKHLEAYSEAAMREGREQLTRNEVLEMARVVPNQDFLEAAADALERLRFPEDAVQVREWASDGQSSEAIRDPEAFAAHCIERAIGSNAESRAEEGRG